MGQVISLPPTGSPARAARSLSVNTHDLRLQCLRVLRCTALAMASSPGGLRFKAGTRPWLDGLDRPDARCHSAADPDAGRAAW